MIGWRGDRIIACMMIWWFILHNFSNFQWICLTSPSVICDICTTNQSSHVWIFLMLKFCFWVSGQIFDFDSVVEFFGGSAKVMQSPLSFWCRVTAAKWNYGVNRCNMTKNIIIPEAHQSLDEPFECWLLCFFKSHMKCCTRDFPRLPVGWSTKSPQVWAVWWKTWHQLYFPKV